MILPGPPRLQLLIAAVLLSTGGAAVKGCGFSSWQVASFRSGIAAVVLLLAAPAARRRWNWRIVAVALAYAATMIFYVTANKLTTAANTIFLQSTAPVYILAISPLLLREHLRRRDLPFAVVMAGGIFLFFAGIEPATATAPHPFLGNVIATVSGVTWAFTITGLRWLARDDDANAESLATIVAGNAIAFAVCLPAAVPVEGAAADWGLVAYLGVFQIALAYLFMTTGMRQVTAFEGMLLLLLEPVLNPVWAWVFHGERPGAWSLAGGAIVLVATAAKSWRDFKPRAAESGKRGRESGGTSRPRR